MKNKCYISKNIESYKETALVFAPNFFRIQESIIDGFEQNNIGVYLFLDKPSDSVYLKSKLRLKPKSISKRMTKYLKKEVSPFFYTHSHPNYVVVFEGQAFLEEHARLLKQLFPNSKTILYCFDSIERFPYIEHNLSHFDKRVTFSYDNYHKYSFDSFVPLFIPKDFYDSSYDENIENKHDLCFIGTGHPPKIKFLSLVEDYAYKHDLYFYKSVFLPSKPLYFYYKITSKAFRKKRYKDFVFVGKTADQIKELYSQSKAVVDAGNPNESGISLRIFECLALQKKVVLATKSIKQYSFYDPNRFLVFPEESDRLLDFLRTPYPRLSKEELNKLSTKEWIKNIVL